MFSIFHGLTWDFVLLNSFVREFLVYKLFHLFASKSVEWFLYDRDLLYEGVKGELQSNYIFLYFVLIGLEWDSINLFTKMNFFFLRKLTFQHHLYKTYMTFYLLT